MLVVQLAADLAGRVLRTVHVAVRRAVANRRDELLDPRLGDLVAISDYDATHGPRWQPGAITVGVVAHGASRRSGHGPGVNVIVTSSKGTIEPIITRKANIAELLGLA